MAWRAASAGVLAAYLTATAPAARASGQSNVGQLTVRPASIILVGPEASQQILVCWSPADGGHLDVTREATLQVVPATLGSLDPLGLIVPRSEGKGELEVKYRNVTRRVPIEIRRLREPDPVSFDAEILPILTKARCNSGACHGKAEGQHGFKLSVFGFDPAADYDALIKESSQRRLSRGFPDRSLVVRKARNEVPHGGGRRIEPGSLAADCPSDCHHVN